MSRFVRVTAGVILAAAAVSSVALAADAIPADGTPEATIRTSLQMLRDNKIDDWITAWCDPSKCQGNLDSIKTYDLATASKDAHNCLHGDKDMINVTRTDGDTAKDGQVKIWVKCEDSRLPVPATLKKSKDGKWLVSSFSW